MTSLRPLTVVAALAAALGGGAALAPAAQAAPTTWYAAPSSIGAGDCTSPADACDLPTAVSDAGNGDTVLLADGDYFDVNVEIDSGITMTAAPSAQPALFGDGQSTDDVIDVETSQPVTISGITIYAAKQGTGNGDGIDVDGGGPATLANVSIAYAQNDDLQLSSDSTVHATDSFFNASPGTGVDVGDGSHAVLDNAMIGTDGDGVVVSGNGSLWLAHSDLGFNNTGVAGNQLTTVVDSTVHDTAPGPAVVNATVIRSGIFGNGATGVLFSQRDGQVIDSTISYNGTNGVEVDSGRSARLYGDSIVDNPVDIDNAGGLTEVGGSIVGSQFAASACTGSVSDLGFNIDDDRTCGFIGPGSVSGSPTLDALLHTQDDNNGDALPNVTLDSGSPAIGLVTGTLLDGTPICNSLDQNSARRPSAPCDAGADETHPVRATPDVNLGIAPVGGAVVGQPMTLTATVTGGGTSPTGTVAFTADGYPIQGCGAVPVADDGTATCPTSDLGVGTYDVRAHYSGDANYTPGTDEIPSYVVSKEIPPTITAALTSAHPETAYGWYRSPVTITVTCTAGSAPLAAPCPSPTTLIDDGVGQTVPYELDDIFGGVGSLTVGPISIDQTKPTVTISGVVNGKKYTTAPHPKCVAKDSLSGVASCTIVVTKGAKKGKLQHYTATATATDKAGNRQIKRFGWDLKTAK